MTDQPKIILASNSPRRKELFGLSGLSFSVEVADIDESTQAGELPERYVQRLARQKAQTVAARVERRSIVIGSDTTVVLDGAILGKPQDPAEARNLLLALRNRAHSVYTGISVSVAGSSEASTQVVSTEVCMRDYSDAEIETYIASGDPMDKAGAYGIQNAAFSPVTDMRQCYASVMGLPLCALATLLHGHGSAPNAAVENECQKFLNYKCGVYHQYLSK